MTVNGPFKRQPCVAARIMICLEFCAGSRQTLACTTSIIYVAGFPITDSSKCCKTSPSFWPSAASHCLKAFVACASCFGTKVCVASFLFVSLSTLASAIFGLRPADDARGQRHRKPERRRHFNRSAYRAEVLSGVHRHACDAVANLGHDLTKARPGKWRGYRTRCTARRYLKSRLYSFFVAHLPMKLASFRKYDARRVPWKNLV